MPKKTVGPAFDAELRRWFPVMSTVDLARELGVSKTTVWRRAQELGLFKGAEYTAAVARERASHSRGRYRTGDEERALDDAIRERYPTEATDALAADLGISMSQVKRRAKAMGLLKADGRRRKDPDKGLADVAAAGRPGYRPAKALLNAMRGMLRTRYGYVRDEADPDALVRTAATRECPNERYLARLYGIRFIIKTNDRHDS